MFGYLHSDGIDTGPFVNSSVSFENKHVSFVFVFDHIRQHMFLKPEEHLFTARNPDRVRNSVLEPVSDRNSPNPEVNVAFSVFIVANGLRSMFTRPVITRAMSIMKKTQNSWIFCDGVRKSS